MVDIKHLKSLRIAMIGTRGVPAHYGGFETAIEEVGRRLVDMGHRVLVYCRNPDPATPLPANYLGMRLIELPALRRRSLETLSHTGLSVQHLVRRTHPDVAVVFNAANAPYLPVLRAARIPVATHVDGLEWRRGKWGPAGRRYYRLAESLAVRGSDALIADAEGIAEYYDRVFGAPTELIAYGAPLVAPGSGRLGELDLRPDGYYLLVARFEVENHVDVVVEGYARSNARLPLVVVGSAPYATAYTQRIHALADGRVRFLGGLWDQELLDQLYAGTRTYYHGHSVGGTNPSLLRAIGAGAPVDAYDVTFNREVVGKAGRYWTTSDAVRDLVESAEAYPAACRARGLLSRERARLYDWDDVARRYEALCLRLAAQGPLQHRPSGRRAEGSEE
ncbi:glycosyltransferase [uncultured Actinomyces sp.]|uniref:glycosyltransferase n=1 Tax=uncultured Actinomyces sp. TaxID=249061 RepID=UPI002608A3D4|nr:glycosyltransferase [uncultured Actinomyces sp.]